MAWSKLGHCYFRDEWLDHTKNPQLALWVKEVPKDRSTVFCTYCKCNVALRNMGKGALLSHQKGKKHKKAESNVKKSPEISTFFSGKRSKETGNSQHLTPKACSSVEGVPAFPSSETPESLAGTSNQSSVNNGGLKDQRGTGTFETACLVCTGKLQTSDSTPRRKGLEIYKVADAVTTAEILWSMNSVVSSWSARSAANSVKRFTKMFPDSETASKIALQKDKVAYTVNHGLSPYIQNALLKDCKQSSYIVLGFDESFNKKSEKEQMDINIRFLDEGRQQVVCRYVTSAFLGHTTAADLLEHFLKGVEDLDLTGLIQISMDGPSVNYKFVRELKQHLITSPDSPVLLNIGSCGLHTCHGAFKSGMIATGWDIVTFLRALYNLFKRVPARRADYIKVTGSKLFPKKYCAIRWIENTDVAMRGMDMLPYLSVFVEKKNYSTASFETVKNALQDPMLGPKLAFFYTVASEIEPFLAKFQSDKPMAPLLYDSLNNMLHGLMSMFVKKNVLKKHYDKGTLGLLDVKNPENIKRAEDIELGHATTNAIKKNRKKIKDQDIFLMRRDACSGLVAMVDKLQKKCPLSYSLTKGLSFLSPAVALLPEVLGVRCKIALESLVEGKWLTGAEADRAARAYRRVCESTVAEAAFKSFNENSDRLDSLWFTILQSHPAERTDLEKNSQTIDHIFARKCSTRTRFFH